MLTSPEGEASQVRLPERYKLLTGDLNFYSPPRPQARGQALAKLRQNDPAEMEKLDETGGELRSNGGAA